MFHVLVFSLPLYHVTYYSTACFIESTFIHFYACRFNLFIFITINIFYISFRQISLFMLWLVFLHFILLFFSLGFRNKTFQGISFYVSPCMQLHEFLWDLYLEPQFLIRMNNYFEFCRHCLIAFWRGSPDLPPTSRIYMYLLPHYQQCMVLTDLKVFAIHIGVKWYLATILLFTWLNSSGPRMLSLVCWPFCCLWIASLNLSSVLVTCFSFIIERRNLGFVLNSNPLSLICVENISEYS